MIDCNSGVMFGKVNLRKCSRCSDMFLKIFNGNFNKFDSMADKYNVTNDIFKIL